MVFILMSAVLIQTTFAFASVPQKHVAVAKGVAAKNKVGAPKKKSVPSKTSKNKQVEVVKNKPEKNSGDADTQEFESRLKKLVEKGTITQDQADTLTQSLQDIMGRMAEAFKKSPGKPSSRKP